MRIIDYDYIAENIANLSRICVRIYKDNVLQSAYDPTHFPTDPASLYLDHLFLIDKEISYYVTPYDQFYGVINHENYRLIIGPTYDLPPTRMKVREFMFELGIKGNYQEQYQELIAQITPMPLEIFLHELCLIYYFISERKKSVADFALYDSYSDVKKQNESHPIKEDISSITNTTESALSGSTHTSLDFESQMLAFVTSGDVEGLQNFFAHNSYGRAGKTANSYIRQIQNIFITTTTLCSRAAIAGGMPSEEALTLSDRYIQRCEKISVPEQIMNLQYNMIMDYATLVDQQRQGVHFDKFIRSVTSYVHNHLTENISVEQIARDLYVSRSHLSTKFKKEMGITLNHYITEQKIKKSMEYLKHTDKSILEISTFLGFSSQGYFQGVFKKITGMTPKEYRDR